MSEAHERPLTRTATFWASVFSFAWLEYRTLRYYPVNFFLNAVQALVKAGMWYFVARFVSGAADKFVALNGGNYVAYVVIGVVFYEAGAVALSSPYNSISTAFWDKRLEGYHLAPQGLWAYVLGRFVWQWGYATVLQLLVLVLITAVAGITPSLHVQVVPALLIYLLFVAAVFGIGLTGASLFYLLEVKQGQEPVSWLVDAAVRITSGVYLPVAALPAWLQGLGYLLPHTYGLAGIRGALLAGGVAIGRDVVILAGFALVTLTLGVLALRAAVRHAEKQGGIGVVV